MSETAQAFGWIQATLLADSAWVAASTGGLAQGFADIGTTPPYTLIIAQVPGADTLTMNARRLFVRGLFQIKAVGPTANYAALVTIADRIDALFKSVSSVALSSGGILECYREQAYAADYPINGQAWSELGGLYNIDLQAN